MRDALGIQPGNPWKWVVTATGGLLVRDGAKARRRSIVSELHGQGHGRYTTDTLLKLTRG